MEWFAKTVPSERMRVGAKRIPDVELATRCCPGLLTQQTESVSWFLHRTEGPAGAYVQVRHNEKSPTAEVGAFLVVARAGLEPATQRFSVVCSTS